MYELNTTLTGIAQDHLGIPTLNARKSDDLDFHTVAVWALREALAAAYDAGHAKAARELLGPINDRASLAAPEVLATLDMPILSIEMARNWLLPLRLPVALECDHLVRALDGLRALQRDLRETHDARHSSSQNRLV
jgi:hypothetical protein